MLPFPSCFNFSQNHNLNLSIVVEYYFQSYETILQSLLKQTIGDSVKNTEFCTDFVTCILFLPNTKMEDNIKESMIIHPLSKEEAKSDIEEKSIVLLLNVFFG